MKRKSGPRFYNPEDINFRGHWAIGTQWSVTGSKDNVYTVEFTERGLTCDCIGMQMHGRCKHTRAIGEKFILEPA